MNTVSEQSYNDNYGYNTAPLEDLPLPETEDTYPAPAAAPEPENDDLDGDEADEAEGADSGTGKVRTAKPASSKGAYRRVAAKALEVWEANDSTRVLAAALTGSTEDVADLTAAIMTAPRGSAGALTDLEEVLEALESAPWEAGVIASALDRSRLKSVWAVLYALEAVDTATPPARADKASLGVVRAANSLRPEQKAELSTAAVLLKRS